MRTSAVLILIPALMLLASGCGGEIALREDPQLLTRAQQAARDGGPVLFRDLTGGDWDRVYAFPGPPSLDLIETEIGTKLTVSAPTPRMTAAGVLVFTHHGTVHRAVRLESSPFDGDLGSDSRAVLVARPHPTARSLEFLDPSPLPRLR